MQENSSQPDIIILGLGPGNPEFLTLRAAAVINSAKRLYLRTVEHPTISGLPSKVEIISFDDYYQEEDSFETVYQRITDEIIRLAKDEPGVIYGVPGDPFIAEATPAMICSRAIDEDLVVEIIPGVSFLEPTFAALGSDPLPQLMILDALDMQMSHFPSFPPDKPALIVQVYSQEIASNTKLTLMSLFPDQHPVKLIHDAGTDMEMIEELPLFEIDRSQMIKNRTALYIPPLEEGTSLESFQEIIAHLRAPDGCPWDREQDHQTLRPNLLEETFEALEAIDQDDPDSMEEEFGDLLLQIVLHAQIASEYGEFTMSDIIQGIYQKLIKRHPHVFADLDLEEPDTVLKNWEAIKAQEREENGDMEKGLLDGVPGTLPALTQAETYQQRAARVGFDWEDLQGVLAKLPEEVNELQNESDISRQTAEVGDILFTIVNIARWMKVDAESALRGANQRFKDRFKYIEKEARAKGGELSKMSLEELDLLWEQSKSMSGD